MGMLYNNDIDELKSIALRLDTYLKESTASSIVKPLSEIENSASLIGRAWSKSWIGYHANVYYENFTVPPAGHHFSSEWGLMGGYGSSTYGNWVEYSADDVKTVISQRAGEPDLSAAINNAKEGRTLFIASKTQIKSMLTIISKTDQDSFVTDLLGKVEKLVFSSPTKLIETIIPKGDYSSRDSLAAHQGLWTPPHLASLAEVTSLRSPVQSCKTLASITRDIISHLERKDRGCTTMVKSSNRVFIGHGHSPVWRELQAFVSDRLGLPWDEFNRVPVAGKTNTDRLSEMLDSAGFAFVVMTAEEQLQDGTLQARMNVIHEVGLFQGRLGFQKAIVILEEECNEFTNIQGLGQIRYPKGNIKAAFEEIRQVIEREGIISIR